MTDCYCPTLGGGAIGTFDATGLTMTANCTNQLYTQAAAGGSYGQVLVKGALRPRLRSCPAIGHRLATLELTLGNCLASILVIRRRINC